MDNNKTKGLVVQVQHMIQYAKIINVFGIEVFYWRSKDGLKSKIGLKGGSKVLRVGFGLSRQTQIFGYFSTKKTSLKDL